MGAVSPFAQLPEELVGRIEEHLDKLSLSCFQIVCKKPTSVCELGSHDAQALQMLADEGARCFLELLTLSRPPAGFIRLIPHFRTLKMLWLHEAGAVDLSQICPATVTVVTLMKCTLVVEADPCQTLQSLHLTKCKIVLASSGCAWPLLACPKARICSCTITECSLHDTSGEGVLPLTSPRLKDLTFTRCRYQGTCNTPNLFHPLTSPLNGVTVCCQGQWHRPLNRMLCGGSEAEERLDPILTSIQANIALHVTRLSCWDAPHQGCLASCGFLTQLKSLSLHVEESEALREHKDRRHQKKKKTTMYEHGVEPGAAGADTAGKRFPWRCGCGAARYPPGLTELLLECPSCCLGHMFGGIASGKVRHVLQSLSITCGEQEAPVLPCPLDLSVFPSLQQLEVTVREDEDVRRLLQAADSCQSLQTLSVSTQGYAAAAPGPPEHGRRGKLALSLANLRGLTLPWLLLTLDVSRCLWLHQVKVVELVSSEHAKPGDIDALMRMLRKVSGSVRITGPGAEGHVPQAGEGFWFLTGCQSKWLGMLEAHWHAHRSLWCCKSDHVDVLMLHGSRGPKTVPSAWLRKRAVRASSRG